VFCCRLALFIRESGLGNGLWFALDCDCASGTMYAWAWDVFLEFRCLGALADGWLCLCVPFFCHVCCGCVFLGSTRVCSISCPDSLLLQMDDSQRPLD
jgi:hypothetical protein